MFNVQSKTDSFEHTAVELACKAALHSLRQLSYDDDGDDDDDVFYVQIYFSVVVYKGYC